MAKLESYSNLAKQQEDLIKKGFCFGQLFALGIYSKAPHGVNIKSSFKQKAESDQSPKSWALAYFNYKTPTTATKYEMTTTKIYKATVEHIPEQLKAAKGKLEVEDNAPDKKIKGTLSTEYTHEKFKGKLALTSDVAVKLSGVFGIQQGGVGLDLAFDTNSLRFVGYNAAAFWYADKYRLVLRHISTDKKSYKFGNINFSGLYNWSSQLKLATAITFDRTKDPEINIGAQYDTDDSKTLKARFDSDAVLGLSVRSKINQYFTLVTATQFKVFDLHQPNFQFGVRIKINQ